MSLPLVYIELGKATSFADTDMTQANTMTLFEQILKPVLPLLKEEADSMGNDASTYKLSFFFFVLNLLYGILKKIKSISLLVTDIRTSPDAKTLGLVTASCSMYSEAFARYDPAVFRRLFCRLLKQLNFLEIPEIQALGRLLCIDGSIFPAFRTMDWAHYKTSANAIKMHLVYELNRMIPVQFICTDANSSEKSALLEMIEAGVTFIADRGYVSFSLFYQISQRNAFFVIRSKANLKYTAKEVLTACVPSQWQLYVSQVTDCKIVFSNDKRQVVYRLVTFVALGEDYAIVTNRFDLKTHEIIMLYAYRWQIELFFRCIKRTFNALHLWSHDPKGIEVHFYIYLIAYLLLLYFKQTCEIENDQTSNDSGSGEQPRGDRPEKSCGSLPKTRIPPARGVVSLLGGKLRQYWKIGIHWLSVVKDLLFQPFTPSIVSTLCSV